MITDIFSFYQDLKKEGIMFCFSGPTSQGVVEGVGEALRYKMELDETSVSISTRVFSIFVEQMQNVVNYSAERVEGAKEPKGDLRYGVIVVGREGDSFYIISGNYVSKQDSERLSAILGKLGGMSKDEMKAYFKEQRRKGPDAMSKGAGLGFIETARRASQPIEHQIEPIDDTTNFFSIRAII